MRLHFRDGLRDAVELTVRREGGNHGGSERDYARQDDRVAGRLGAARRRDGQGDRSPGAATGRRNSPLRGRVPMRARSWIGGWRAFIVIVTMIVRNRRPRPACLAGERVFLAKERTFLRSLDPCRLVRQVKESWRQRSRTRRKTCSPARPASGCPGWQGSRSDTGNASSLTRLVHLPGKLAGVPKKYWKRLFAYKTRSPAGRAGRGPLLQSAKQSAHSQSQMLLPPPPA